jgi:hypothetical protein
MLVTCLIAIARRACLHAVEGRRWALLVSTHRGTLARPHGVRHVAAMIDLLLKMGAVAWQRLTSPILVKFMIVGASGCVVNSAVLSITYGPAHLSLSLAVALASEVVIIVANYL